jgi:hypothetical protein
LPTVLNRGQWIMHKPNLFYILSSIQTSSISCTGLSGFG